MSNQPSENDEKQSRPVKHFGDGYWIDLVRGLNPGNCEVEMQQHLDAAAKYAVEIAIYGYICFISVETTAFMNHPKKLSNR
jgi:hypothetical protein